jgi:choline dehydrogenase-like flavoprotein
MPPILAGFCWMSAARMWSSAAAYPRVIARPAEPVRIPGVAPSCDSHPRHMTHGDSADVLIVGGGSAAAVLAARLAEDASRTVLLLEAGHAYALDAIPRRSARCVTGGRPQHDWGYTSRGNDPQPEVPIPRGKVLGDSSSVNAADPVPAIAKWPPTAPKDGAMRSVVDSVGAVKCIERPRVVDASIIPEVPSTATNLTVIMLAEKIFERAYGR